MVAAVPPKQMRLGDWSIMWPRLLKSASFTREFVLVWDWETSAEKFLDSYDIWTRTHNLQPEHSGTGLEGLLNHTIRRWNVALILGDLGEWEEAEEELHEVIGCLEKEHSYMQDEVVVKLLLEMGKSEVNSKDEEGLTLLSHAVIEGHSTVVKLLLKTGKADIERKDRAFNQTPLLRAAEYGHKGVVKLLLERVMRI
jgi:hypothetical protein